MRPGPGVPATACRCRVPAAAPAAAAGAAAAVAAAARRRRRAGRRHPRRQLQPSDRRRVGSRRQHLRRRRHRHQQPHREVRQGRQLHQALGPTGTEPGPVQRREGIAIDARATSTSPTPATSASRCSTATARSSREFGNVGTPLAMCMTRGADAVPLHLALGDADGMDDAAIYKVQLDGTGGRQVRLGRQAAEGVRPRQLDRLPQRERAARRRDDELARAEGHAQALAA